MISGENKGNFGEILLKTRPDCTHRIIGDFGVQAEWIVVVDGRIAPNMEQWAFGVKNRPRESFRSCYPGSQNRDPGHPAAMKSIRFSCSKWNLPRRSRLCHVRRFVCLETARQEQKQEQRPRLTRRAFIHDVSLLQPLRKQRDRKTAQAQRA